LQDERLRTADGRHAAPLAWRGMNRENLHMPALPRSHHAVGRGPGFSLIEILTVLAIAAILVMVALPAYNESVRKSRRSDAMTALTAVQQAQERWRANNAAYTTALSDLNLNATAPWQYYEINVAQADATSYIATALGKSGTSQDLDTNCKRLGVRVLGGAVTYAGCGACGSFAATDFQTTHACWPQ